MSITINVNESVETITATIVDGDETITATINELPRGTTGPQGPTGATGAAGPNTVTTSTSTTITGILKGNGSTVLASTAGTDYLTPTGNGSGLTGLKVTRVFADQAAVNAATPDFIGQIGYNTELSKIFFGFETNVGSWTSNLAIDSLTVSDIGSSGNISATGTVSGSNITTSGNVTGNAATSTALATSRNIFGLAFDGTANVSGDATNAGHFASIPTGGAAGHFVMLQGTAPTLVAGRTALYGIANGFGVRDGTGTARTVALSGNISLANNLTTSGNFALTLTTTGTTNVTLPVSGTLLASGGALGTPTSGTLTNCTGYSVKNLADVQFSLAATDLVRAAGVSGNDLTATLASGKTYRVNAMVKMTGSAGGSFVSSISGPNCSFGISFYERAGFEIDTIISSLSPLGTSNLHSNTGATSQTIKVEMIIKTSASGTLTFGWTAVSATGTRNAGSYLRVELLD